MNYNLVAGMDDTYLDRLINDVYTEVYPALFKNEIEVGIPGIKTVGFDINESPVVTFESTSLTSKSASSFFLQCPIILTLHYILLGHKDVKGKFEARVDIITSDRKPDEMKVKVVSAALDSDSELIDDTFDVFVSALILYLNNQVFQYIPIPTISHESITISTSVPVTQAPYLLGFAAIGNIRPDIPAPSSWPTNSLFTGMDTTAIEEIATITFPAGPAKDFDWTIFKGKIAAQVHAPKQYTINEDGSLSGKVKIEVLAQLTMETPWPLPRIKFGPKAKATVKAELKPYVEDGDLLVSVENIPIPVFSFNWGMPTWINWFFVPLQTGLSFALNAALAPLLSNIFQLPDLKVLTLPVASFTLANKQIEISIPTASTSGQDDLLLITAEPKVAIRSKETRVPRTLEVV